VVGRDEQHGDKKGEARTLKALHGGSTVPVDKKRRIGHDVGSYANVPLVCCVCVCVCACRVMGVCYVHGIKTVSARGASVEGWDKWRESPVR
jgi:hypothetical protein